MRIKNKELRIKLILTLTISFFVFSSLFLPLHASALETPNPATLSAEIKEKLKVLQEEIASKAAELKQDIGKKLQNRVYFGQITSKGDNSFVLTTKNGTKNVTVNEFSEYIGKSKVSWKLLTTQDYIAALGDIDDNDVITAKRVVKIIPPKDNQKKIIFGQIVSTNDKSTTIQTQDNQTFNLVFDEDTTYQLGNTDSSAKEIKTGRSIVTVTATTKTESLYSRFVYIFPEITATPTKIASPSATASPTAKPKAN